MTNEEIVDELLHEAEELKLRTEVLELTTKLMDLNPRMERVEALELSLRHLKNLQ
jgi:hypothetical protein